MLDSVIKGKLKLEINQTETEAFLVFTPALIAEAWTREKIIELLRRERIIETVNPLALEKALQSFAAADKGAVKISIASGLLPEMTNIEGIVWEENPVPVSLENDVRKRTAGLKAPQVFEWPHQKPFAEKDQKKKRKGKESFPADAHGEKKPKTVNPAVKRIGYVRAGGLVATLQQPKQGLPGKNVRGEVIYPPEPKTPEIFYSEGFSFREGRLCAATDGILRVGEDWAELIPYVQTQFELTAKEDGSDCLLFYSPGSDKNDQVTASLIISEATRLGFAAEDLLSAQKIDGLVREAKATRKPVKDISLCLPIDAVLNMDIPKDRLSCVLHLKKSRSTGKPLILGEISQRIRDAKITQMDTARVKQDIIAFFNNPKQRELKDYALAQGMPPTKGDKGSFEWETGFEKADIKKAVLAQLEKISNPKILPPSLKDFPMSGVKEVAYVIPDQKILRIVPAQRGKPGTDVSGRQIPGLPGDEVNVIPYENVKKYGFFFVSEIEGLLEYGMKDDAVLLRVRPHRDAKYDCEISLDGMQVLLFIVPHTGSGEPATAEKIKTMIKDRGISAAVKQDKLDEAVALCASGKEVKNLVIAEGTQPVHAQGERFVVKVQKLEKKQIRILADGRADFKSVSNLVMVKKGDLVAEITPPTSAPKDGIDVKGKRIPARTKAGTSVPDLVNLRQEKGVGGVIRLYTDIDGEFFSTASSAGVRQIYVIPADVGYETGNVQFPGSILVKGSVQSGFTVFSKADISIEQFVDKALISADGSITVKQGIKGGGKAILRARGSVSCAFAENAVLLAISDVGVAKSVLNCIIRTNGKLIVGKSKGTLMGGIAKAQKGMELNDLGSSSEVKTAVSFGQDYVIGDRIEIEERELDKIKQRSVELEKTMLSLQKNIRDDAEKLIRLREEKLQLLKIVEKHNMRLFALRERFEQHFPCEILVRGTVYRGVILESHGRTFIVKQEQKGVRYTFNSETGKIEESFIRAAKDGPIAKEAVKKEEE